ncbi:MAG TPA: hypothetical protein VMS17_01285 [Gemmataceae bacterium]|nr:hypothetical protein [Gemmataceae bacterium]
MRSASLVGVLTLAALLASAGRAWTDSYDAVIRQETDVRSGHGDGPMFYPTNHLHVGDRVRVVNQEDGGWLAIVPPSGSFSWIRKDLLYVNNQMQPPVTVVNQDGDVRIGTAMTKQAPVVGKRVPRGTIVTVLPNNREVQDSDGVWVPIYPPEGELRYIRADAIQQPAAAAQNAPPAVSGLPTANPPPAAPQAQDAEALYRKAIDAEKYNPQEAVALYNQGAGCDADANRAKAARDRANWLLDSLRNPSPNIVPGLPAGDPHVAAAPTESKVNPLPSDPPAVRLSAPQGATVSQTSTASAAPNGAKQYSTTPGWLQASGRNIEGRKTYMMMSDHGTPLGYYVTAEPGVNLDQYVRRRVECYGEAIYDGQLRANYMRVSRVELREGQ